MLFLDPLQAPNSSKFARGDACKRKKNIQKRYCGEKKISGEGGGAGNDFKTKFTPRDFDITYNIYIYFVV